MEILSLKRLIETCVTSYLTKESTRCTYIIVWSRNEPNTNKMELRIVANWYFWDKVSDSENPLPHIRWISATLRTLYWIYLSYHHRTRLYECCKNYKRKKLFSKILYSKNFSIKLRSVLNRCGSLRIQLIELNFIFVEIKEKLFHC